MPVTRRRGDLGGEERHVGADARQRAPASRRRRASDAPSERRPRRQAAAASDEPPPSPAATGIRFSRVRQTRSGARPMPASRPRQARFSRAERQRRRCPSPSTRRPEQPGSSSSRSASSSSTSSLSSSWKPSGAPPRHRQRQVQLGRRLQPQRRHAACLQHRAPAAASRQAHCSTRERLRALLRARRRRPRRPRPAPRGPHRSSRDQGVVQLLAPLPEAGLHQPVERLAPRRPAAPPACARRRRRRTAESTLGRRLEGGGRNARHDLRLGHVLREDRQVAHLARRRRRSAPPPRPAPAAPPARAAAPPPGSRAAAGW